MAAACDMVLLLWLVLCPPLRLGGALAATGFGSDHWQGVSGRWVAGLRLQRFSFSQEFVIPDWVWSPDHFHLDRLGRFDRTHEISSRLIERQQATSIDHKSHCWITLSFSCSMPSW